MNQIDRVTDSTDDLGDARGIIRGMGIAFLVWLTTATLVVCFL
jgi:hypothetical protein